ncbi:unnamed protein product [Effrenium voratum]|uniref:Uncharacterized protein n=1 Tax=Effrenium voratum TaxID=2562239 RepID=A0AA36MVL4_9DINO|nr:unnamed protein product [Effrenium voratum]CAJ1385397.1 unnamed protein product [Effrenium voratum]CAJ1439270.1 unnamed protein product [Effrenium voratum]
MYLKTVLQTLSNKKQLEAEDLYKLNEATFNVPEEESIDDKMAAKLFAAVEKVVASYTAGRYDKEDSNFFYDYVALLGMMQNQHFFSGKQHQMMLSWLKDALGEKPKGSSKAMTRLEEENRKLQEEMKKLKDLTNAVQTLRNIRLPEAEGSAGLFCRFSQLRSVEMSLRHLQIICFMLVPN